MQTPEKKDVPAITKIDKLPMSPEANVKDLNPY